MTLNVASCTAGVRTCLGGGFGACVGQVIPEQSETCNAADDDCDGATDEDEDSIGCTTFFQDADGDWWGDDSLEGPCYCADQTIPGYANRGGDCDDSNPAVKPDSRGSAVPLPDGSFDYICDGEETPLWGFGSPHTSPSYCRFDFRTGCQPDTPGFRADEPLPACGQQGQFVTCYEQAEEDCWPRLVPRLQQCR